jgi:hypothetical protein
MRFSCQILVPFWNPPAGGGRFRTSLLLVLIMLAGLFAKSAPAEAQQTAGETPALAHSESAPAATADQPPRKHKVGRLEISGSWRARVEGWDWFEASSGDNQYAFMHSLLRVELGQESDRFDWKLEGAQDAILALPGQAVALAPQGQLGLGGTYFVSNGNRSTNANGFVKQAYLRIKKGDDFSLQLGRFEFIDGVEVVPKDATLATVAQTRVSQRLVGNFGWSAVGRSLDGARLSANYGDNNFTLIGSRPTRGVYQVDGMGELDVDLFYGSYIRSFNPTWGPSRLRVFAIGYIDDRTSVLKTDNRPSGVRSADHSNIRIATYGADFLQVFDMHRAGKLDLVLWGVWQNGSWGTQEHRAAAGFVEFGWRPEIPKLKPWFSVSYCYGSGDANPNDATHGTFFQILPTPRPYARFPFWNMENNRDLFAAVNAAPASRLTLRSELHSLKLASASDLWYLGGGAFQPRTFGYTGRPANGHKTLARVWDVSADYSVVKNFTVGLYYGHAWGGPAIESLYPKNANGQMAYLETNLRF